MPEGLLKMHSGFSQQSSGFTSNPSWHLRQNVTKIILATVVLHNYLQGRGKLVEGHLSAEQSVSHAEGQQQGSGAIRGLVRIARNADNEAKAVRNAFMAYFANEGRVE